MANTWGKIELEALRVEGDGVYWVGTLCVH